MSDLDHKEARPLRPGGQEARIGVRALLTAGDHRPQVALVIPGAPRQIRLSAEEAAELAGRLLSMVHMARYDAAVFAALGQNPQAPDVHEAMLVTLIAAREEIMAPAARTAEHGDDS